MALMVNHPTYYYYYYYYVLYLLSMRRARKRYGYVQIAYGNLCVYAHNNSASMIRSV